MMALRIVSSSSQPPHLFSIVRSERAAALNCFEPANAPLHFSENISLAERSCQEKRKKPLTNPARIPGVESEMGPMETGKARQRFHVARNRTYLLCLDMRKQLLDISHGH
jgi:hypothetical protein